ncbi:sucrose-specific PTS transporter subunit IIBC [Corynebacterium choanae]|uniref:protein-N(pi)-phosphohistidine--sucrose phosphotransferase n=1 Tax=Corynebacterium choanae TaxID=1862358 RepID=A0A3G6J9C9_9CORY|nr:sucrose-specific PTS transporter subunit IIBC [Corynebacterium choanae]AZA14373.1 PTS system beta-glucoside-specific EIIBCA component [Corynebacterium choanae]
MDHHAVAARVLTAVGGEENIVAAAHCATRLRMVLKDTKRIDVQALDSDPDLKGTFETGGMFQIIVGPGDVNTVFAELDKQTAKNIAVTTEELKEVATQGGNWLTRAIKALADIFVPLIPILVGGGLLMALNNVLVSPDLFGSDPLIEQFPAIADFSAMINLLSAAPFAFLPVLVGFTATKRFGGNEFLGAGIAMAMVMPSLVNGYQVAETIAAGEMSYWNLFGLQVAQAGYQGTVLPVLVVSYILATIEKFFHRHFKGTVDFLVTPVLTLLITGFLTFIAVGPAMRWLGDWLAFSLARLYELGGPIGGFIFGLIYSPIVITGLHQSFPPIETLLWSQGGSFIFATASVANIAQGAVCLAVFFLARSEKLKGLAGASGVSAVFGITEPAIFGVNLRLRWPFYIGIGAAAIGSTLIAIFDVKAVALGAAGFIGIVSMRAQDYGQFIVCAVVTFIIAFAAAFAYGKYLLQRNGTIDPDATSTPVPAAAAGDAAKVSGAATAAAPGALSIAAPLTGEVIALDQVSDPMFAAGKLGHGVAINPTKGVLTSPISGTVIVAFDTGHAFAVRGTLATGEPVEVLMHIGFDTVNLRGAGFQPRVAQGDSVTVGDVLCEFDIAAITDAGYPVTTPVVVSNYRKTGPVRPSAGDMPAAITAGDPLLIVDPKSATAAADGAAATTVQR